MIAREETGLESLSSQSCSTRWKSVIYNMSSLVLHHSAILRPPGLEPCFCASSAEFLSQCETIYAVLGKRLEPSAMTVTNWTSYQNTIILLSYYYFTLIFNLRPISYFKILYISSCLFL